MFCRLKLLFSPLDLYTPLFFNNWKLMAPALSVRQMKVMSLPVPKVVELEGILTSSGVLGRTVGAGRINKVS